MDKSHSLNSADWTLYYYDSVDSQRYETGQLESLGIDKIRATVPGNYELDFARTGLLPDDIFKGMSAKLAEKYETYEFIYFREFDTPDFSD